VWRETRGRSKDGATERRGNQLYGGVACRGKKGAEGMILSLLRSTDCGETRVVELVSRYLSRGVGSGLPADRWLLAGR
jgi:hypothetical protein